MKNLQLATIFSGIIILINMVAYSATYDIRFDTINSGTNEDKTQYFVKVQLRANSSEDEFHLGGANITFQFNTLALTNPQLYQAYNFNELPYAPLSVANPGGYIVSLNITYLIFMGQPGTHVGTDWMDIAQIVFEITDPNACYNFIWNSPTSPIGPWVLLDDDNLDLTFDTKFNFEDCPSSAELTHFDVRSSGNDAVLSWTTSSERYNFIFEIQRFNKNNNNWEKIDTVHTKAYKGNSSNLINYNYRDVAVYHPRMGYKTFYYRLKNIDMNLSFEYSMIKTVRFENYLVKNPKYNNSTFETFKNSKSHQLAAKYTNNESIFHERKISITNYPNPFSRETTFEFYIPESGQVELVLFDLRGLKIQTIINGYLDQGTHKIQWTNESLSKGVYLLNLSVNNNNDLRKINIL